MYCFITRQVTHDFMPFKLDKFRTIRWNVVTKNRRLNNLIVYVGFRIFFKFWIFYSSPFTELPFRDFKFMPTLAVTWAG